MDNDEIKQEQEHYDKIMMHLTECNVIQFAIDNQIPTYRVTFALADYLSTICLIEGKNRGDDDFFLKMAIDKMETLRKEYMSAKDEDNLLNSNREN